MIKFESSFANEYHRDLENITDIPNKECINKINKVIKLWAWTYVGKEPALSQITEKHIAES